MKHFVVPYCLVLFCASPVAAEEGDGSSLMDRGVQQFLEGLLLEMEPAFEDLREFLDQMGPSLMEILQDVQDWSAYEPPEVLENGDIIIRRKRDGDDSPDVSPDPEPLPQIEL